MSATSERTPRAFALDECRAILSRTPATVRALLDGLPESWWTATEGRDTWSPLVVIGHLIHADQTNWIPRVRGILEAGEARPFADFDRFGQMTRLAGWNPNDLLGELADVRRQSLDELASMNLGAGDLDRTGRHPAFGPVTLRQLLATWVVHDLDHLVQIERVMARQYADAVGPWREYLRVIREDVS